MRDERNRIAIERTDAVETERKKEVPRVVRVVHYGKADVAHLC